MEYAWRPEPLGERGRPGPLRPAAGQEQDPHGIHGMHTEQSPEASSGHDNLKLKNLWVMLADAKIVWDLFIRCSVK